MIDDNFCDSFHFKKLVESKKTATYQIPRRCFEANYILVLLREVYGFPLEGVRVHFVERVEGKYLEWVTGVFVKNVMCTIENLDQKSELWFYQSIIFKKILIFHLGDNVCKEKVEVK